MDSLAEVALVVDDSPDTLGMLSEALEAEGISVLMALDGSQALKIAHLARPDIILLDAVMPNMNGFETCARLKEDADLAEIPVIFMTGLTETEHVVRALEAGGVDYVNKPIDPEELIARMRVHLGNARRTHSVQQALDRTGQHLVSLASDGTVQWATDQAQALLGQAGLASSEINRRLGARLVEWMQNKPRRKQTLSLSVAELPIEAMLLSDASESSWVFRLADPAHRPTPATLREALPLTERESDVLFWIAYGKTNREIGEILSMSPRTVNKHLEAIFQKLGVENRTSAATAAIRFLEP